MRLVELFRQAFGFENDAQQCQANLVAGAGTQLACGSVQTAVALALNGEFFEWLRHCVRQPGQAAGGGTVGELVVGPQGAQHFGQVRFAAAVKARNPDAGLLVAAVEVEQKLFQHGLQAFFVLAITNKGFQFVAQHALGGFGMVFRNFGHAVVDEAVFIR